MAIDFDGWIRIRSQAIKQEIESSEEYQKEHARGKLRAFEEIMHFLAFCGEVNEAAMSDNSNEQKGKQ